MFYLALSKNIDVMQNDFHLVYLSLFLVSLWFEFIVVVLICARLNPETIKKTTSCLNTAQEHHFLYFEVTVSKRGVHVPLTSILTLLCIFDEHPNFAKIVVFCLFTW